MAPTVPSGLTSSDVTPAAFSNLTRPALLWPHWSRFGPLHHLQPQDLGTCRFQDALPVCAYFPSPPDFSSAVTSVGKPSLALSPALLLHTLRPPVILHGILQQLGMKHPWAVTG